MKLLSTVLSSLRAGILLILLFLSASVQAQLRGDSFAEAKAKGSATVTFSYIETPGFAMNQAGKVSGFCVEIMNEFAKWLQKEEGIVLNPVYFDKDSKDFAKFMNSIKGSSGGVFGLGNITITEERKNSYNFSPPFITNVAILMTNKSVPNLNSLEDIASGFSGMTLVAVRGTLNERRLLALSEKYYPGVNVKYVASIPEALQEVAHNEKAFTELDFTYYLEALSKRMPVKRHPVGDEDSEKFGIIMPKNSDWAPVMARFMNSGFVGSTEYRKLIVDHMGPHALKLLDAVSNN
ncbi:substrate-binding periplasmic protein [Nafulsella turpanensis]|uniref:substrate-binding periplasmic protein n=1 Tax=Nafulsella turpanensis TaxID=1265690 RepID=UPI0003473FAE|nr:transporter substrate-binding domain-containing protein [Nafulsella turpanensis]